MRVTNGLVAAALFGLLIGGADRVSAQAPPAQGGAGTQGAQGGAVGRRPGGFVPGQQRPPGDPAQIARGKTLYGVSCRAATAPTCAAAIWADRICCGRRLR